MKKTMIAIFASVGLLGLSSASNGLTSQEGGTLVGGVVGGVIGGSAFHGGAAVPGIIGGAIVGGIVGGAIGKSMDQHDRSKMHHAAIANEVGKTTTWKNEKNGKIYTVETLKVFTDEQGHTCKEIRTTSTSANEQSESYTSTICKRGGKWHVVKE